MRLYYLVAYDISDDFRLNRVLRYMKGKGIHLQYSVFYCYLSQKEAASIMEDIRSMIDINQDDVRFYPIVRNFKTIVLGRGAHIPKGVDIYLE